MDEFKTECDLGDDYGDFNIKERLLEIKFGLVEPKERLTDQKHDQKEAKKSKNAELSKSLGKLEPVKFRTAKD